MMIMKMMQTACPFERLLYFGAAAVFRWFKWTRLLPFRFWTSVREEERGMTTRVEDRRAHPGSCSVPRSLSLSLTPKSFCYDCTHWNRLKKWIFPAEAASAAAKVVHETSSRILKVSDERNQQRDSSNLCCHDGSRWQTSRKSCHILRWTNPALAIISGSFTRIFTFFRIWLSHFLPQQRKLCHVCYI